MSRILDIGAGTDPHPLATDAVEIMGMREFTELVQQTRNPIHSGITYYFEVNMNTSLPFAADTFSMVISRYSIGTHGRQNAFREAYRVLQPGGQIQIVIGGPKGAPLVATRLRGAGFEQISSREIPLEDTRVPDVEITAWKPAGVLA